MKLAFDEISPITGDRSVLIETDDDGYQTKFCIQSGYMTTSDYISGTPQNDAFEFTCPDHILDTKFVSENGQVWYKVALNQGDVGLYPDVYDGESVWYVGKWVKAENDVNVDGSIIQVRKIGDVDVPYIFDTNLAAIFEDFELAYNHFNQLVNEQYND